MRRNWRHLTLAALSLTLLVGPVPFASGAQAVGFPPGVRGDWQGAEGGAELIRIEAAQVVTSNGGKVAVARLVGLNQGEFQVRSWGLLEQWAIALEGEALQVSRKGEVTRFRRLHELAPELELRALPVGKPGTPAPDRVVVVQKDIEARIARDQEVRKDESRAAERKQVDRANCKYLKELLADVGWVDRGTFGASTAGSALILAKHCNDLTLMVTLLPYIEKDFKHPGNNDDAQVFSVFYDGLQLALGNKQRYGSQLGEDSRGNPMVLPLEDVERVDQLRKDLGLSPLAEYLALASKFFYDGKPIRLPRNDE